MLSIAERKLYYSISAFKFLKLNCGYLDFKSSTIKLNYSNSKIKILTFNDLFFNSESVDFVKHFNLLKLSSAVLLGEDLEDYKFYLCTIINCLNPIAYNVLKQLNSYVKYRNDTILLSKNSSSGIVAEVDFSTNGVSIISILIKKLIVKFTGGNND